MNWKFNPFTKRLESDPITASISDGDTTHSPDGNSVFDALALKLTKSDNLSDCANTATAFSNIKQSATTSATGVVELATDGEALSGLSTTLVITPNNMSYVFNARNPATNNIGSPGQLGFGVGIAPPELLPTDMVGMPGYEFSGHDNYGNYQYAKRSTLVWVPWHVYRIAHASNPTYADYTVNSVDIKGTVAYPWRKSRVTAITKANPAVVTTEAPHGRTAGDYIWLSHITSDANWKNSSGQLYKVGTVGSTTTFNLQTAAGVDVDASGFAAAFSNATDLEACVIYTGAENGGYATPRAMIDGGKLQQGYFYDKYKNSKIVHGTGYSAASIKNSLPISTASAHNPIDDLTSTSGNYYYEAIRAAKARNGVDGAESGTPIFFEKSIFQSADIALLSLAHGQAAKTLGTTTTYCAWYHATYNFPKGLNNNQAPAAGVISNADYNDNTLMFESDGYSNCGKVGSGSPFAKTTHNGQNSGIADVMGLMYEIDIGVTNITTAATAIADLSRSNPCIVTWNSHGMLDGAYVQVTTNITQADWTGLNSKVWAITYINANSFSIAFDSSGFGVAYDADTDPGTMTGATFYVAKPATAMKNFTHDATEVTGHWGATGVAAMMEAFTPVFETGGVFAQHMGSGSNQVLSGELYGAGWLLTGIGSPKDSNGIDPTGTDLFGKDYWYQYVVADMCLISRGDWDHPTITGVWTVHWNNPRTNSNTHVGLRAACYPE